MKGEADERKTRARPSYRLPGAAVVVATFSGATANGQAATPRARGARRPRRHPRHRSLRRRRKARSRCTNGSCSSATPTSPPPTPNGCSSRRCPTSSARAARRPQRQPRPTPVRSASSACAATTRAKVDVLLQAPGGRFLGQWPRGKGRADRQLWEAYELHAAPPPALKEIPPQHWFGALRDAASPYLQRGRAGERFLLYDAEVRYAIPLQVAGGKGTAYELANSGAAPLHDLTVYKPQDGAGGRVRWSQCPAQGRQGPGQARHRPVTAPADVVLPPGLPSEVAARIQAERARARSRRDSARGRCFDAALCRCLESHGDPRRARHRCRPGVVAVAASPGAGRADRIRRRRDPADPRAPSARHGDRLTAVYRLDPTELDRLLPLEVTPTPRKTVRVGLMIARNIDPAVGDEIDQLIANSPTRLGAARGRP